MTMLEHYEDCLAKAFEAYASTTGELMRGVLRVATFDLQRVVRLERKHVARCGRCSGRVYYA